MVKKNFAQQGPVPFQRGKKSAPDKLRAGESFRWIPRSLLDDFRTEGTDAHRLVSGSSAWIERFGADLLLSYQHERDRDALLAEVDAHCARYEIQPSRIFGKYLPQQATERSAPVLLRGDASLPMETEIAEGRARFGLDFAAGYSAGFFIDQRANRARVAPSRPARLLNTFAYTCSFSVVAALAGAETVSIDLSRRSLVRGEENFRRNQLDPKSRHKFIADDVLAVLPRLARRGEKFDAIILDPPSFSRNQSGAAFRVQHDFDRLVGLALEVAAPGAKILLSVNHSEMRGADLERMARAALRIQNRSGRFSSTPALPDFPPGHAAKTVWLELIG